MSSWDLHNWKIDGHAVWLENAGPFERYYNLEHPPSCESVWVPAKLGSFFWDSDDLGLCAGCDGPCDTHDFLCPECRGHGHWETSKCDLDQEAAYAGLFDLWYPEPDGKRPNVSDDPDHPTLIAWHFDIHVSHSDTKCGWKLAPEEGIKLYREFGFLP